MAVTRIRGLTQIQSGSIEPSQLSQSIAGNGILLTDTGGVHFDPNYESTFSQVLLQGPNSQSIVKGYVTIEGSTTLPTDAGDRPFGLVVENDISASHIFAEFFEVSSSAIVSSGSNIFGSDVDVHTHEFTGSILTTGSIELVGNQFVTGNIRATGDVTAERFIVSSSEVNIVTSTVSGSSAFGDTFDDVTAITGSLKVADGFTVSDDANVNDRKSEVSMIVILLIHHMISCFIITVP